MTVFQQDALNVKLLFRIKINERIEYKLLLLTYLQSSYNQPT